MAVMPALHLSGYRPEFEEHLLEARSVGGPQFGQRDAGVQRHLPDEDGIGVGVQGAVSARVDGQSPRGDGLLECAEVFGAHHGARGVQQVGLGALGDDPAVADHHDVIGDDLDLVEQV
jgi:hypothetical protein